MRTRTDQIKCTECPSEVQIKITGQHFIPDQGSLTDRLAAYAGWDIEQRRCPIHKEGRS